MMRLLLLTSAAMIATTLASHAADLPSRRAPPVYAPPVPVFSWTGAYFGINAGYAFDNYHNLATTGNQAATQAFLAAGAGAPFARTSANGFTGGGQIGYNYEIAGPGFAGLPRFGGGSAALVVGVEGDAAYTDARTSGAFTSLGVVNNAFSTRTEYVGTARGRLGVAFGTLLAYGTAGFAYGGVRDSFSTSIGGVTAFAGGRDRIATGYAFGGGLEYAIPTASFVNFFHSSAVTVKAEFIHYDLGNTSTTIAGQGAATGLSFTTRDRVTGNLARAGLNYKLDFAAPAPVVARY